jgi:hypothetical protein
MDFTECISHAIKYVNKSINISTDYMHFSFALLRKNKWYEKVSYGYK